MTINNDMLLTLFVYSMAVFRISHLLVYEYGPYLIFLRLRALLGTDYSLEDRKATYLEISELPDDFIIVTPRTEIAKALSCVWCMSIWVSLFFVICHDLLQGRSFEIFQLFSMLFAISGLVMKIEEV